MENDLIGSYLNTITSHQKRVLIGFNVLEVKLQQSLAKPDKDKYAIRDKINASSNGIKYIKQPGPASQMFNASHQHFHQAFLQNIADLVLPERTL